MNKNLLLMYSNFDLWVELILLPTMRVCWGYKANQTWEINQRLNLIVI